MFIDGMLEGGRSVRRVLGKRTGYFELEEADQGFIVPAAKVYMRRSGILQANYSSAADGSGLFKPEVPLDGRSFEADSRLSIMAEWRGRLVGAVSRTPASEMRRWYPLDCAKLIEIREHDGARALYEIRPAEFSKFDDEGFEAQHERLGRELATECLACDGQVFTPTRMPFIAVRVKTKVEVVPVINADIAKYAEAVRIFGLHEYEDAMRFAEGLGAEKKLAVAPMEYSVEVLRPEFFVLDPEVVRLNLTANAVLAAFSETMMGMASVRVALDVPIEELELARRLRQALGDPEWMGNLEAIEAAIENCLDYEERTAAGRFVETGSPASVVMVDEWRNRAVRVDVRGGSSGPPPRT